MISSDPIMHSIAVHGGAGTLAPADLTPDGQRAYRAGLERALRAGFAILDGGGASLDAVVAAVQALEDDPLFNAGRGAVIAANGVHELDASVMDGRDLRAGAVTGVHHVGRTIHHQPRSSRWSRDWRPSRIPTSRPSAGAWNSSACCTANWMRPANR